MFDEFALDPQLPIVFPTEADIGSGLMARHPDAVPAAWSTYHASVHALLRRALGSDADVDDVVQEVFLCLFRRAGSLRSREAVRPFVLGIARHMLRRELRTKGRRGRLAQQYEMHSQLEGLGPKGAASGYAEGRLSQLLLRLTPQERSAFVLRFGHAQTVAEVAQALGVSEPTVKRRVAQARRRLAAWATREPALLEYVKGERASFIYSAHE